MVPEGWKRVPLDTVAEIRTGVAKGKSGLKDPISVPYLRVANVQDGRLDLREVKTIEIERSQLERYSLKKGDVLMNEGGDFDKLGRGDVWNAQIEICLHQNHVFAVRPNQDLINPYFLAALTGSHYGKSFFLSCAKKSTNLASINSSQLKEFQVLIPPLTEQNKICNILSIWNKAITTTEQLLTNSRRQKQALMQQLLTGKKRLSGFHKDWIELRLEQLFSRVTTKNTEAHPNVVTISAQQGLIRQDEFFNKTVSSKTLDNYFLLKKGQFAYNKSYSNGYPMGAIKRLTKYEKGVVTTLYICFEAKDEGICNPEFFEHYFEAGLLNQGLSKVANEGGRAHGLLNVKPSDFFSLKAFVPDVAEQKAIATILDTADREILTIQAKLACLKDEKKALMQQILTGKRRVKIG